MKKDGLGSVSLGSTTPGPPGNDEEKVSQLNATKMRALINLCNKRSTHSIVLFSCLSLFFVLYENLSTLIPGWRFLLEVELLRGGQNKKHICVLKKGNF